MNTEVLQVDIVNILYSDHAFPISMSWRWRTDTKKIGYWRLNNFLLEDISIGRTIETEIRSFFEINEGTADSIITWDCFKAYIRGIFISQKA